MSSHHIHPLPRDTVCTASGGDAGLRLALHQIERRMVPLLVFTSTDGRTHVIELTGHDVARIRDDLDAAFAADRHTADRWWRELCAANRPAPITRTTTIRHREMGMRRSLTP